MATSPPVRPTGGLVSADDPAFIGPNQLRDATGGRYPADLPRLEKALGRASFNSAAPSSGTSSVETLDFNAATDKVLMAQGTGLYATAVSSTGTFAAMVGQTEFTTDSATAFVVTAQTGRITKHKFGDSFVVADGVSRPIIIENNSRARNLGLIQPKWKAIIADPGSAGTRIHAQATVASSGVVTSAALSYDTGAATFANTYATLVKSGAGADASLTVGWTSTAFGTWGIFIDAAGSAARKDPDPIPFSYEPTVFEYVLEVSTDSGATFARYRTGSPITGRVSIVDSLLTSTTASSVQIRFSIRKNGDGNLTGSASMNLFDISLGTGAALLTHSTANAGIRYCFSEVRKYQRLLEGSSEPVTIELESGLTPLAPDEDADPLTFTGQYGVHITRGALANSDATHWRVYRSIDAPDNNATKLLDEYSMIADLDTRLTSYVDTIDESGHPLDFQNTALAPPVLIIGDVFYDANTPPPDNCDVVGSFQGSTVYASSGSSPGRFWWSRPLQPDYVPAIYSDLISGPVTGFVDIGVLLVMTPQNIVTYSFLPLASDTEFFPSRTRRVLSSSRGNVSRRGYTLYQPRGSEMLVAFVAHDGIYVTNGAQVDLLSSMLDWQTIMPVSSLATAQLVDDPLNRSLCLTYLDEDGLGQMLRFFYSRPDGVVVVGGPQRVPTGSLAGILQTDGTYRLYSEEDGLVYVENTGTTDEADLEDEDGTITFSVQTGQLYLNGPGGTGSIERLHFHTPASTSLTCTCTVSIETRIDGNDAPVVTSRSVNLGTEGWKSVDPKAEGRVCESFNVTFSSTSPNFPGINAWNIEGDGADNVTAGRLGA